MIETPGQEATAFTSVFLSQLVPTAPRAGASFSPDGRLSSWQRPHPGTNHKSRHLKKASLTRVLTQITK